MALLLRHDNKGACLRSLGDPPNGVLAVAAPAYDTVTFVIDPNYGTRLDLAERGQLTMISEEIKGGMPDTSTPVSVVDALRACEGHTELGLVIQAVSAAMIASANQNAALPAPVHVAYLQAHVDFVAELRDALLLLGMLRERTDDEPPDA